MSETSKPMTASEQFELGIALEGILAPFTRKQRENFYKGPDGQIKPTARFVHYTTAEAALDIIRSKRVWMRNTICMSDYREVQHGFEVLQKFFSDMNQKERFLRAFDDLFPNVMSEAVALFDSWWADIRLGTYITSISEHDDKEDLHGRLSMWRAFGGGTGRVALVLRIPWFSPAAMEVLKLAVGPVAYFSEERAHAELTSIVEKIPKSFLLSIDRTTLLWAVFSMLVTVVTCWKHEGFVEEREWRIIYSPNRMPSPLMEPSVEVIGGIPQTIYKLPLDAKVSDSLSDLDAAHIFDRLIIGPSQFPAAMREAFVTELKAIGIQDADNRVAISGIPIRT